MNVISSQYTLRDGVQTTTARTFMDGIDNPFFIATDGGTPPVVISGGNAGAALRAWIKAGNTISPASA